jgi:hypothetical protein
VIHDGDCGSGSHRVGSGGTGSSDGHNNTVQYLRDHLVVRQVREF